MNSSPDCRTSICEVLRILSSPERQLDYQRRVPHISIPAELISMWFDDTYLPESEVFRECFTAQELSAMAEFNDDFSERLDSLPDSSVVATLIADEDWQQIERGAQNLLLMRLVEKTD